jgi:hypothetical protein
MIRSPNVAVLNRGGDEAGPIGMLSQREGFHWLVAPRSTIIQTSEVLTGRCGDSEQAIERLMDRMVRTARSS